jgi:rhodanese-related sulfurtransferase
MKRKNNSNGLWATLLKDFATIAAILVLSGMVGTALNWRLVRGAWAGEYALGQHPAPSAEANLQQISLQEVRGLNDRKKAVFVDARRDFFYVKEHIAGALALPLAQFDDRIALFQQQVDRDRLLITYCSGYGCEDSHQLALKLQQAGYKKIRVYTGGLPEWKQVGLPTEGTDSKSGS